MLFLIDIVEIICWQIVVGIRQIHLEIRLEARVTAAHRPLVVIAERLQISYIIVGCFFHRKTISPAAISEVAIVE